MALEVLVIVGQQAVLVTLELQVQVLQVVALVILEEVEVVVQLATPAPKVLLEIRALMELQAIYPRYLV